MIFTRSAKGLCENIGLSSDIFLNSLGTIKYTYRAQRKFACLARKFYLRILMHTVSIKIQTLHRRPEQECDAETFRQLSALVRTGLQKGHAPGSAVAIRESRIDIIPLAPLATAKVHMGAFMAGLTRSRLDGHDEPIAVGLLGRFTWRRGNKGTGLPVGMVFLEWPDGRWWHWRVGLEGDAGRMLEDSETLDQAEDGLPKPRSLGGWWSLGRRRNLSMDFTQQNPALSKPVGPVQ